MSDYQKMVQEQAKTFFDEVKQDFAKDEEEFGGASDGQNLSKWLDRTRSAVTVGDRTRRTDWLRLRR